MSTSDFTPDVEAPQRRHVAARPEPQVRAPRGERGGGEAARGAGLGWRTRRRTPPAHAAAPRRARPRAGSIRAAAAPPRRRRSPGKRRMIEGENRLDQRAQAPDDSHPAAVVALRSRRRLRRSPRSRAAPPPARARACRAARARRRRRARRSGRGAAPARKARACRAADRGRRTRARAGRAAAQQRAPVGERVDEIHRLGAHAGRRPRSAGSPGAPTTPTRRSRSGWRRRPTGR